MSPGFHISRLCAALVLGGITAGVAAAASGDVPAPEEWFAMDRVGTVSDAELLGMWQTLTWDRPAPPKPAVRGAVTAISGYIVYRAFSGGASAGVDLARPKRDDAEE